MIIRYGSGQTYYVGTEFDDLNFYLDFISNLSGLMPLYAPPPEGVEISIRTKNSDQIYFIMNYSQQSQTVTLYNTQPDKTEFIDFFQKTKIRSNQKGKVQVQVNAMDVKVLYQTK